MFAETTPPPAPPPKIKVFFRRLASFVVLWSIVLSAMFSGHKLISDCVFLGIMVLLAGFGLSEFYGLVEKRELVCFRGWGIFAGMLLIVGTFFHLTGKLGLHNSPARVNDFETSFLVLFVLGLSLPPFASLTNPPRIP